MLAILTLSNLKSTLKKRRRINFQWNQEVNSQIFQLNTVIKIQVVVVLKSYKLRVIQVSQNQINTHLTCQK